MSRLRRRLEKHRAARAAAFDDAVKIGDRIWRSDDEYRDYLIENGATAKEAQSIINARRGGQVDGQVLRNSGNKRRQAMSGSHPWKEKPATTPKVVARVNMRKKSS